MAIGAAGGALRYSKQMRAALCSLTLIACAARSGAPDDPSAAGGSAAAAPSSANRTVSLAPALAPPRPDLTCTDAAAGFDRATRGMRSPEASFRQAMHERCMMDAWPAGAISCFAAMIEGGLGQCAVALPKPARDRMFAALGSGGHDGGDASSSDLSLALSIAKLQTLKVGVPACDAFVSVVQRALACTAMSVETRVALGAETVDFWSLPTNNLPEEARQKMSDVCQRTRGKLEAEILAAGCMP